MRNLIFVLFTLALSTFLVCQNSNNVEGASAEIALLHTNNVIGRLFPCPS